MIVEVDAEKEKTMSLGMIHKNLMVDLSLVLEAIAESDEKPFARAQNVLT